MIAALIIVSAIAAMAIGLAALCIVRVLRQNKELVEITLAEEKRRRDEIEIVNQRRLERQNKPVVDRWDLNNPDTADESAFDLAD